MTELHVDIGDLVLGGAPASYGATFGPLVEARIELLARGMELPPQPRQEPRQDPEASLADQVALEVWEQVRRATDGLRGGFRGEAP